MCYESILNILEVLSDIVYICNVINSLGGDVRNISVGKLIFVNLYVCYGIYICRIVCLRFGF